MARNGRTSISDALPMALKLEAGTGSAFLTCKLAKAVFWAFPQPLPQRLN